MLFAILAGKDIILSRDSKLVVEIVSTVTVATRGSFGTQNFIQKNTLFFRNHVF